ncbi:MAG: protein kinase [Clostridia bacterium]|nr:protein kinase [Clostridia bacterium]
MSDIRQFSPLWGEWEIDTRLGEGSYGTVWRVRRNMIGGKVYYAAVKHISIPKDESEVRHLIDEDVFTSEESAVRYYNRMLQSLADEIDTMHMLQGYTNIVSYEDHMIIPKPDGIGYDLFLRMELLTPLTVRMKEQMTTSDVIRLGCDIATAIEILNNYHLVHRDIKPQNIFVNATGDYKLGDYGTARAMESAVTAMSRKGTYNYMAPEIYRSQPADSRVDIYSLGLVMYRLMNGNRLPFLPLKGEITSQLNEAAMMKRLSGEPLPPPQYADQKLADIILKMCAFRPEDRYLNAGEVKRDLEACQGDGRRIVREDGDDRIGSASHQFHFGSTAQEARQPENAAARGMPARQAAQPLAKDYREAATAVENGPGNNGTDLRNRFSNPSPAEEETKPGKKRWLIPVLLLLLALAVAGILFAMGVFSPDDKKTLEDQGNLPWTPGQTAETEQVSAPALTNTTEPTATPSPAPTASATNTPTAMSTAVPTNTPTAAPAAVSATKVPATATPVPTATVTATPGPTNSPTPVPTATPVVTAAPTPTLRPTESPTSAPTATPVQTATPVPTATPIPSETPTPEPEEEPEEEEETETEEPEEEKPAGKAVITYPAYGRTTEKKVNVRYRADRKSKRVAYITYKRTLTVITDDTFDSSGEKWYKVKLEDGETGFVLASVMELQDPAEAARFPFLAKTTSKKVNCRAEADTGSRRLTYIQKKGTVVSVLDEIVGEDERPWYKIQLEDGRIGYARSEYFESENDQRTTVSSMNGNASGPFTPVSAKLIRNQKTIVYSGPGEDYLRPANGRAMLTTNNSAYVYGQENGLVLVQYQVNGGQWRFGYVSSSVVENMSEVPLLSFGAETATVVKKCNLTDDPLHSKGKLTALKLGQVITCLARLDQWVYVDIGTARGFVQEANLKFE